MFFVMGMDDKQKILKEVNYNCNCTNNKGIVILEERRFSLFFFPIFSWNKKYYLECKKCHSIYKIKLEFINEILKKEEVFENYLEMVTGKEICKNCGQEMEKNYRYCPYCGNKNKE